MDAVEFDRVEARMNDRASVFPDPETVGRLALSDSGFVFDPSTGRSYSVNESGLAILRLLQKPADLEQVVEALQQKFAGEPPILERDVIEFASVLRGQIK